MEEIFHLDPLVGDAANATDLSDLFQPGVIPNKQKSLYDFVTSLTDSVLPSF